MGEIKSSLEMVLARTAEIDADPEGLEAHRVRQQGKVLFGKMLQGEITNLRDELRPYKKKESGWIHEGLLESAISNISLPTDEADLQRMKTVQECLRALPGCDRTVESLLTNVSRHLKHFLEDRQNMITMLRSQFAQRAQQREAQLSQQMGMPVRLDPASDPEFTGVLRDNLKSLRDRYQVVITQAQEELGNRFRAK